MTARSHLFQPSHLMTLRLLSNLLLHHRQHTSSTPQAAQQWGRRPAVTRKKVVQRQPQHCLNLPLAALTPAPILGIER
jgi:hypothetical protein